ncbi:MAG: CoA transferase [Actinomycetota bacterium]|nr:CoA transferase [Actinomycetota bacterium]
MSGPLTGLRVVELGDSLAIAQAGNLFADFGAEVVLIEPPTGAALRSAAGFAFIARGKKSVVLDCNEADDAAICLGLMSEADVVLTSIRPATLHRWGLDFASLSEVNPRLVFGQVTAWGLQGPLAAAKGSEGMVMAKIGANYSHQRIVDRDGPTFTTVPFASWSAGQTLLQGVFAALRERESSGLGQMVDSSLAHSLGAQDPWTQAIGVIAERFPDAFTPTAQTGTDGAPNTSFLFKLLVAITKDGYWVQFAEVQPRLFRAFMHAAGLDWMYEDSRWAEFMKLATETVTLPDSADAVQRFEFWNLLLDIVRSRTLAEWQVAFDEDPNVFAEVFRRGTTLLHHPQMEVEKQLVTIQDRELGPVLQPGALIRFGSTPAELGADAPRLGEHQGEVVTRTKGAAVRDKQAQELSEPGLPLAGVTILELGTFYAAPFGATILTDLGARVIKIETLDGDPMRTQQAFPEAGAMKVLQGKQSVALDLATAECREVLAAMAPSIDLVLCAFRMGVADRLGVGAADLLKLNPRIMYLESPGFGIQAPYGNRPAFAPVIGAGSGIAMRNVGQLIPEGVPDDFDVIRTLGAKLTAGGGNAAAQADGVAALGVGTALAFAAYLQTQGIPGQALLTTMLQSCAHALAETMVEYPNRPDPATAGTDLFGLSALYRLYPAGGNSWVFLSAPKASEWLPLIKALGAESELSSDARFATAGSRQKHDGELAEALQEILSRQTASQWEAQLLALDVGCVEVNTMPPNRVYMTELAEAHHWLQSADSPVIGEYPRLRAFAGFSRSTTINPAGCTIGQHTAEVLNEFGFSDAFIADLVSRGIARV